MLQSILNLLGIGSKPNYADLVANGAIIVDVRNHEEFKTGHIKDSINLPVNGIRKNIGSLEGKQETTIITCCVSGMRSASAKGILKAKGFQKVYNGGGWKELEKKIS